MNKSFKVRIYPTKEQQMLLEKTFGASRFVYNHFLKLKQYLYQEFKIKITYNHTSKMLTELKRQKPWLRVPDKWALGNALKDLDTAYTKFYKGAGYPKFKRKGDKNSYRTNDYIKVDNSFIKIPKVGLLRYKDAYKLGKENILKIYNVTISKTTSGKYYASISAEVYIPCFERTNQNVGIDLGLKDFAIFSSGVKIKNPRILKSLEKKYKRLAKAVSRKKLNSNNRNKAKLKLARFHEKISNIRKDFLHKLSKKLSEAYNAVVVEDLNMKGMSQALNFGKSVGDNGWGIFLRMLEYKLIFSGKQFLKIDKWFPSSKTCSKCGNVKEKLKLSERSYKCECCGIEIDRDYNAALNIKNIGKAMLEY